MGFLTGKTKPSTQTSKNAAYPWLQSTFSPMAEGGVSANSQMQALLGLGGDIEAANRAFGNFRNATGYQNILGEAMRGVSNSAAGRGLLGSGATARALQTTAGNLANQSFNNYFSQLGALSGQGLQAGSLIGSAADTTTTGTSERKTPGALGVIGGIASLLSDRRTKENIHEIGRLPDGLGVYTFFYKGDDTPQVGVMADEVETLRPWALGPETPEGFKTVNYEKL